MQKFQKYANQEYNTRVNRKKPWGVVKNKIAKTVKEGQSPFFCYYNLDIEIKKSKMLIFIDINSVLGFLTTPR